MDKLTDDFLETQIRKVIKPGIRTREASEITRTLDIIVQALFAITLDAMRAEQDEVALQGIEFWSNVCDEEVDLQIEASEATEAGRPPEHVSRL